MIPLLEIAMPRPARPIAGHHTPRGERRPSPSARPVKKPDAPACPECGRQFRTDEAVQTHRHAAHGTAATIVGDMTRCPECGSLVNNKNMPKHRRREHGIISAEE